MLKGFRGRIGDLVDIPIFLIMAALCVAGLVTLYSAGYDVVRETSPPMQRQAAAMGMGLIFFLIAVSIQPWTWRKIAIPLYGICVLLLLMVDVKGAIAGGAQRWLELGPIRMQPSEFSKIAVIFLIARYLSGIRVDRRGLPFLSLILSGVILAVPAALTLLQPDLGTACVIGAVGGAIVLYAGVNRKILIAAVVGAICLAPIAWFSLHEYQQNRVLTFLDPQRDPLGAGYHALQSQIAVGSGGVFGMGYMQGSQTQLRFLPEQHTDFIFSVLAEEWGFAGTLFLVTCYFLLCMRLIYIALQAPDTFSSYVVFGVLAMMGLQSALNIGMVIGLVPVVGITLPLFSHGGSSVITVMTALGVAAGMRRAGRRRDAAVEWR